MCVRACVCEYGVFGVGWQCLCFEIKTDSEWEAPSVLPLLLEHAAALLPLLL